MQWLYTTSENTTTLTAGSGNNFLKFSKQLGMLTGHLPNICNTGSLRVLSRDMLPTNNHIFTNRCNRARGWYSIVARLLASHHSMWPGFDSGSVPHVCWVCCQFLPCLGGFSLGTNQFFPPSTKTNISNFHFDQDVGPAWKPAKADAASSLNIEFFFYFFKFSANV